MRRPSQKHKKKALPFVLAIDDELENLELIERALGGSFEVATTGDMEEAISIVKAMPDCVAIFCDQRLTLTTGSSLLSELGKYAADAERILISGYASYEDLVEAINVGSVDRYLEKPISPELLRQVAENASRRFNERRQGTSNSKKSNSSVTPEAFKASLDAEIGLAGQGGEHFSLLVLQLTGQGATQEAVQRAVRVLEGVEGSAGPRRTDIISSLGNGEFAIFLRRTPKDQALRVATRIAASLRNALRHETDESQVSVTIGLAEFPRDGMTFESLMEAATQAVDLAWESGGDLTIAYSEQLTRTSKRTSLRHWAKRVEAVESLIRESKFQVVYQPIVDMQQEQTIAYEALCRPSGGDFAGPSEVFGLASSIGAVGRLGQAIRKHLEGDAESLPADQSLFLNLHPDELMDAQLLDSLAILGNLGNRLVLEITEVAEVREVSAVVETLKELRENGVRVAVDDFGAGHSGVSRILHLHPDYIKLDASLMKMIGHDAKTDRFLKFLMGFCNDECIELIAEGVEDAQEKSLLLERGIRLGQGFLFGRPSHGFEGPL